jgi:hypothetical protein
MKYLCLIYDEEKTWEEMPKAQFEKEMGGYRSFTEDVRRSGHFLAGQQLQPVAAATTVRVRNGKTVTTDGPFAETKETLGGFYMLEARDLNEAIQLAARIPSARFGSVEVRPVVEG